MLQIWLSVLLLAELFAYVALVWWCSKSGVSGLLTVGIVLALAFAWRASHALGSFLVAGAMRFGDRRREPSGTTWQALVSEFRARLISFNWSQPFASVVMRSEPAGGGGVPILLVHGYFSNRGMWVRFRERLVDTPLTLGPIYKINLEPPLASIDVFAAQLQARVAQIVADTGQPRIHIIAHSMGGLVARAYIAAAGAQHIASLTTLGSPHHGTALAMFGVGRCVKQMRPASAWLNALADREATMTNKPATLSIYTTNDDLVYPPETSVLPWADNVIVQGVGHVGLLFSEAVIAIVVKRITSIDGISQAKMPEDARQ